MDSNSHQQDNQNYNNKKLLIVKIPANVKNYKKTIDLLGGKNNIMSKVSIYKFKLIFFSLLKMKT